MRDVCITIDGKPIVYDFNFDIKDIVRPDCCQGQIIAFLGPSGIGKTQLFMRISGLEPVTSGEILIGKDQKPPHPGDVGVVFQSYPLWDWRTVEMNLWIAGHEAGIEAGALKEAIPKYLEAFGLLDKAKAYPWQLSGGQRQRVSIMVQLLRSSNRTDGFLLLMDEPVSGLDPVQVNNVCSIIKQVVNTNERNSAVIVTHDVSSALCIADTVVLIGRKRDANGNLIPGATKIEEIDMIERNLAWHPEIMSMPEFHEMVRIIKSEKFPAL